MELTDIHRVREILCGPTAVSSWSNRGIESLAGSLTLTLASLVEFAEQLASRSDEAPVGAAARELAGVLREATCRAQVLHAAAQGEARQVQRRLAT